MFKLLIFEHFFSVGRSQAKTGVIFQAEIFLLNCAPVSAVCEALAVNEFRLLDGASEYLQLVDLCAVLMKTIADGA